MMMIDNPMYSETERLEILNGYVKFQNKVITNLRQQILNLRTALEPHMSIADVDNKQYAHLSNDDENTRQDSNDDADH
jgi:hypothetical protein